MGSGSSCGCGICLNGHGRKRYRPGLLGWGDFHTSQYQVLTRLAQFSLAREPHVDKVETPEGSGFDGKENLVRRDGSEHLTIYRGVGVRILPSPCTGQGVRLMRFYGFGGFLLKQIADT
ncbi:regulatory signaling modulator protein AmpE [Shigella flexneri]